MLDNITMALIFENIARYVDIIEQILYVQFLLGMSIYFTFEVNEHEKKLFTHGKG